MLQLHKNTDNATDAPKYRQCYSCTKIQTGSVTAADNITAAHKYRQTLLQLHKNTDSITAAQKYRYTML